MIRFSFLSLSVFLPVALYAQQNLNTTQVGQLNTGAAFYSNIWGWTSPSGKEYAILGEFKGTSFIDITDGANPVVCDFVSGNESIWREIQVWDHYAYVVVEWLGEPDSAKMGAQIIDLSPLSDSVRLVRHFRAPVGADAYFVGGHSLHIRDGFLYINGGTVYGTAIFDLADPENPVYRGFYRPIENNVTSYTHDCYVRNDTLYTCDILNGRVDVVDVKDKSNPRRIARILFPEVNSWWPHNAALSEDGNFLMVTDENPGIPGFLSFWDLRNFRSGQGDIDHVSNYRSTFGGLVHNAYVKGDLAVMSYYNDGVHLVDIADPQDPIHVGNFDNEPMTGPNFSGAWGVYPFFASGKMIISDMENGLFIFSHNGARAGRFRGTVRDVDNGQPVPFARLYLQNSKLRLADAGGAYTMGGLPGNYSLLVQSPGYYDTVYTVTLSNGLIEARDLHIRKIPTAPAPSPTVYTLRQNYPNPFNPTTHIGFELPAPSQVRVTVYNLLGQEIATVADRAFDMGVGTVEWNGTDRRGFNVASGVYLYRLEATNLQTGERYTETKRLIVLR
jgi:choice-of-anchor B domain-containing protein